MRQTFVGTTNSLSGASRSRVSPEADLALRREALERSSCNRISRSCWHLRHSCSRMSPLTAGLGRTAGRGGWGQERSSKPDQQTLHWANRSCQRLLLALLCLLSKDLLNCFANLTDVSGDPEIHIRQSKVIVRDLLSTPK